MSEANDKNAEQAVTGKEIQASIDRAQTALNRLDNQSKRLAQRGQNPAQSQQYWDALLDVDMAVLDAFDRIRKYLRVDRDEYWNRHVIGYDEGVPVVLGGRQGEIEPDEIEYVGQLPEAPIGEGEPVAFLEEYEGAYESYQTVERERFGDPEVVTKHVPRLLDADDYRRALRVLDEARRKLGFTPTPKENTPRTEITREMIDDVEEWRQNNLPEQYLNGNDIDN